MTLEEIWDILTRLDRTLVYIGGGLEAQNKAIAGGVNMILSDVLPKIASGVNTIASGVGAVNDNINYSRSFVVDKLSAKIDAISLSNSQGIKSLETTVINGNKEILQSIKETNAHIDEVFSNLGVFIDKIVKGLEESIKQVVESALDGLTEALEKSNQKVVEAIDRQSAIIENLNRITERGLERLATVDTENTKLLIASNELIATKLDTRLERNQEAIEKVQRENFQLIAQKMDNLANAVGAGAGVIAASILANFLKLEGVIAGSAVAERLQWAPLIAAAVTALTTLTSFWDQVVKPVIDDPEKAIAEVMATVTKLYYNVGRKTYDIMELGGD